RPSERPRECLPHVTRGLRTSPGEGATVLAPYREGHHPCHRFGRGTCPVPAASVRESRSSSLPLPCARRRPPYPDTRPAAGCPAPWPRFAPAPRAVRRLRHLPP